jgi:replicative DNA helicase
MSDTAEAEVVEGGYEFDDTFQRKIAALALRDTVFAQRTEGLIEPSFFENDVDRAIINVAQDYYTKYKTTPDKGTIPTLMKDALAAKKIRKEMWPDLRARLGALLAQPMSDRDYVITKVADFAKNRAMQNAIMASVNLLDKGDYAGIEQLIRQAVNVGISDDASSYDYFGELASRTAHRNAMATGLIKPDGITTGFADMDKHLFHGGWGRKELTAFMARAKFGKSMALGDFGKNAFLAGYNVLICSCEVSARIYADRLDANFAETAMMLLKDKAIDVEARVWAATQAAIKVGANFKLHDFAAGTLKPSMLRRLLEKYRGQGIIFDLIITDYADIMCPERVTSDPIENSKSVWIDLRAIAYEQNAAVLTATQTNRDGAKAATAKATDVAEDFNKIRIADLTVAGNATEAEISAGEARINFAASRNQKEITFRIAQNRSQMKFFTKILGIS